jgi:hypothetical protein
MDGGRPVSRKLAPSRSIRQGQDSMAGVLQWAYQHRPLQPRGPRPSRTGRHGRSAISRSGYRWVRWQMALGLSRPRPTRPIQQHNKSFATTIAIPDNLHSQSRLHIGFTTTESPRQLERGNTTLCSCTKAPSRPRRLAESVQAPPRCLQCCPAPTARCSVRNVRA